MAILTFDRILSVWSVGQRIFFKEISCTLIVTTPIQPHAFSSYAVLPLLYRSNPISSLYTLFEKNSYDVWQKEEKTRLKIKKNWPMKSPPIVMQTSFSSCVVIPANWSKSSTWITLELSVRPVIAIKEASEIPLFIPTAKTGVSLSAHSWVAAGTNAGWSATPSVNTKQA